MTTTSLHVAADELRRALDKILVLSADSGEGVTPFPGPETVAVDISTSNAILLADWINSHLGSTREIPGQLQFSFTTE
jgi:hypothetical protein